MTTARPKVAFLAGPMYGQMAGPRFVSQAPPEIEAFLVDAALRDEEKINLCKDIQALLVLSEPYDFSFLRSCPNIKLVQSLSAGNDYLDLKALAEMGLPIASNGAANAIAVAEHAITLMLAVIRDIPNMWRNTTLERNWREGMSRRTGIEITGKTVGIVGMGHIGRHAARLLRGFDTDTIYYDVVEVPGEVQQDLKARPWPSTRYSASPTSLPCTSTSALGPGNWWVSESWK